MALNKAVNLHNLVISKIEELSPDGAASFFGKGVASIRKWISGSDPGIGAGQKILDELIAKGIISTSGEAISAGSVAALPNRIMEDLVSIFGPSFDQSLRKMAQLKAEHGSLFVRSMAGELEFGICDAPTGDELAAAKTGDEGELVSAGAFAKMDTQEIAKAGGVILDTNPPHITPASSYETKSLPADTSAQDAIDRAEDLKTNAHRSVTLLLPSHRDVNPRVMVAALGQWKSAAAEPVRKYLPKVEAEHDTLIHRARNLIATRWLESGQEWGLWMDSDIIASFGNPNWFRTYVDYKFSPDFISKSAIEALMARKKPFIAAPYVERGRDRRLVNQIGFNPSGAPQKEIAARYRDKGPFDKMVEVAWTGFGFVLMHRVVLEDIIKHCPEVAKEKPTEPYGFFQPSTNLLGEDIAFCERARRAGHQIWVDMGVPVAHVGNHAFLH